MIPFTQRELNRAWRQACSASSVNNRNNAHRLLLFYAVECGLKAAYLKRQNIDVISTAIADELKHDLNKIMTKLCVGKALAIPKSLTLKPFPKSLTLKPLTNQRNAQSGDINQVWRYGGILEKPTDAELEKTLETINEWIKGELT